MKELQAGLDSLEIQITCPECHFLNPVWLKQVRLRDVVICRGCKDIILLVDCMGSVASAKGSVVRAVRKISDRFRR